jgi:hypothetical protein
MFLRKDAGVQSSGVGAASAPMATFGDLVRTSFIEKLVCIARTKLLLASIA